MIGRIIKTAAAVLVLAVMLCSCKSAEEKEFLRLKEIAESKSGTVYRTTYFAAQPNKAEGFPYPVEKDGKYAYAYMDEKGNENVITAYSLADARDSYGLGEEKFLAPAKSGEKWGYLLLDTSVSDETELTWAVEPKYDNAECFTEQAAAVRLNGKYGVIDENGDFTLAPYYDAIKYRSFTYMPALKDGEWYFIDPDGRRIFGPFEDAESYEYGYAAVKKDGKWGFIDKNGLDATAFEYDEAFSVEDDGCAWVRTGKKWKKVQIR